MRISSFTVLAFGFGLVGMQLSACSSSSDDCTALATCGNAAGTSESGSAGKSGGGGAGPEAGAPSGGVMSGGSTSGGGSTSVSGAT
ncbi:MAG TPA: hypothetical protein VNG33_07540, partial [Polyangiaceae bacterium]|nr:hypothetical protein [Polyangiaceae bacterium]